MRTFLSSLQANMERVEKDPTAKMSEAADPGITLSGNPSHHMRG